MCSWKMKADASSIAFSLYSFIISSFLRSGAYQPRHSTNSFVISSATARTTVGSGPAGSGCLKNRSQPVYLNQVRNEASSKPPGRSLSALLIVLRIAIPISTSISVMRRVRLGGRRESPRPAAQDALLPQLRGEPERVSIRLYIAPEGEFAPTAMIKAPARFCMGRAFLAHVSPSAVFSDSAASWAAGSTRASQ